jgi:hypothetical protein
VLTHELRPVLQAEIAQATGQRRRDRLVPPRYAGVARRVGPERVLGVHGAERHDPEIRRAGSLQPGPQGGERPVRRPERSQELADGHRRRPIAVDLRPRPSDQVQELVDLRHRRRTGPSRLSAPVVNPRVREVDRQRSAEGAERIIARHDPFRPHLDDGPVAESRRPDAAPHAIPRLDHRRGDAAPRELPGCSQAGEAGPDHDHPSRRIHR